MGVGSLLTLLQKSQYLDTNLDGKVATFSFSELAYFKFKSLIEKFSVVITYSKELELLTVDLEQISHWLINPVCNEFQILANFSIQHNLEPSLDGEGEFILSYKSLPDDKMWLIGLISENFSFFKNVPSEKIFVGRFKNARINECIETKF